MKIRNLLYGTLYLSIFLAVPLCAQEDEGTDPSAEDQEERVENGLNPARTSHEGSNHKYVGCSQYYDFVKLEDGSYWSVNPDYQEIIKDWFEGDPVAITQAYKKWWGNNDLYPLALYNRRTDEYIEVKFAAEPEPHNFYRRYIYEINKTEGNSYLILNDNTLWPLREKDRDTWDYWIPGDVLVIGTNNTYLSYFNPNILINTHCSAGHVIAQRQK